MWRILSDLASVLAGLTANRLVRTNASKQLESNAALTSTQLLYADGNGWPATSANMTFDGTKLTVAELNNSALTASRLIRTDASKNLESNAALTNTGVLIADSSGWPSTSANMTFSGTLLTLGTGATGGLNIAATTGTTLIVSSSQAATSSSSGCATFGGGVGVAGPSYFGDNLTITKSIDVHVDLISTGAEYVYFKLKNTIREWHFANSAINGSFYIYDATGATTRLTLSTAGVLTIACTTDSTSKDTGSIVTEGGIGVEKSIYAGNEILSVSATDGVGYGTGAGGTVTQITSRTTGVTLNKVCGEITLVSAAGSATWQSFTVTNSAMAATDNVIVNQKSGTDLYMMHVTAKAAGSFRISFATTGGTTSEQPVFGFSIIKSVAA
jgi:hypothetical protein